jgi:hypothetical protein
LSDQLYDELEQDEHYQVLLNDFFAFGHRVKRAEILVHDQRNSEMKHSSDNEARYDAEEQPNQHQYAITETRQQYRPQAVHCREQVRDLYFSALQLLEGRFVHSAGQCAAGYPKNEEERTHYHEQNRAGRILHRWSRQRSEPH